MTSGRQIDAATDLDGCGDAALVVGVARRSAAHLGEVFRRHGGSVYALSRHLCGSMSARRITTGVLLDLWNDPEAFDPAAISLRAHLIARAHRRATELARTRPGARNRPVALEVPDRAPDEAPVAADDERSPIVLAYLGGRTYHEIADALRLSEREVLQSLCTGLRSVRTTSGPGAQLSR